MIQSYALDLNSWEVELILNIALLNKQLPTSGDKEKCHFFKEHIIHCRLSQPYIIPGIFVVFPAATPVLYVGKGNGQHRTVSPPLLWRLRRENNISAKVRTIGTLRQRKGKREQFLSFLIEAF